MPTKRPRGIRGTWDADNSTYPSPSNAAHEVASQGPIETGDQPYVQDRRLYGPEDESSDPMVYSPDHGDYVRKSYLDWYYQMVHPEMRRSPVKRMADRTIHERLESPPQFICGSIAFSTANGNLLQATLIVGRDDYRRRITLSSNTAYLVIIGDDNLNGVGSGFQIQPANTLIPLETTSAIYAYAYGTATLTWYIEKWRGEANDPGTHSDFEGLELNDDDLNYEHAE